MPAELSEGKPKFVLFGCAVRSVEVAVGAGLGFQTSATLHPERCVAKHLITVLGMYEMRPAASGVSSCAGFRKPRRPTAGAAVWGTAVAASSRKRRPSERRPSHR